jgi:protein disulfide-isomerase A1
LHGPFHRFFPATFFSKGKAVEYTGGRTADTIVAWVEKKTGPPAVTLDTVDAAKKFIDDNKVAIVGFFKVIIQAFFFNQTF